MIKKLIMDNGQWTIKGFSNFQFSIFNFQLLRGVLQ